MKLVQYYRSLFADSRRWIYAICGLAIIWILAGVLVSTTYPELLPRFLAQLDRVFENALGGTETAPTQEFAGALFVQNFTAAGYALGLGIFLGVLPIIAVVANFFTLGFLLGPSLAPQSFPEYGVGFWSFVTAIAPHGIFELPALLLACAFGFRAGWLWLLPSSAGRRWKVLGKSWLEGLSILPIVALLLGLAALIEAFVTLRIV